MSFVSTAYINAISDDKRDYLARTAIALGCHPTTNDVMLLPDRDRYAGTYVLGVQGVGKSALLENMIEFDHEAGNAVIVIDPHGDLISHCIATLPAYRLEHTYLLDMEDEAYPFGVNVFSAGKLETSVAATQAVERIMHIFEVLWADVLSQQNLPRYVRAATITLLSNPGSTLVDMYRFLLDEQVRKRMLQHVTEPTVRQFWQTQYDDLREAERLRRVLPLIGRLESLFMGRSLVRNIVGQRKSTINFRQAIENREVILIKLPVKTVTQDARLIGTMIMAQIHAAVFSYADVAESERPGVSLYVDECQHFTTSDFSELLSEGRKYGMKLTLAHQYRGQLPSFLQDATITARTKIVFQTTPQDGRELASVFPAAQEEGVKPEDIEPHAVDHLLTYGHDNPIVRTFIETYLRPMQSQKKSSYIEIRDIGFHPLDLWYGSRASDVRAADPTPWLNSLLYRVMQTGDPSLPIPVGAVKGFANCGVGFYPTVRGLHEDDDRLLGSVRYPPVLVVADSTGEPHWTRRPESGGEQFYHLIFHLRETMLVLAEEPIGKKSAPNTSNVAQMLTSLPRRAAFVRMGESVGVIYTNDTPPTEGDLAEKLQAIRQQTREKYCHPREEIEQLIVNTDAPKGQAVSTLPAPDTAPEEDATPLPSIPRWEEL